MAKFNKKKDAGVPEISTASLPDVVFMLLFFFMVATTMRDTELKVRIHLPKADQVEKLENKNAVMYIYAGEPSPRYAARYGTAPRIQLNDKFATIEDVRPFIMQEINSKNPSLRDELVTSLKIDKETNMSLVSEIKYQLRRAEAYRINYTTEDANPVSGAY